MSSIGVALIVGDAATFDIVDRVHLVLFVQRPYPSSSSSPPSYDTLALQHPCVLQETVTAFQGVSVCWYWALFRPCYDSRCWRAGMVGSEVTFMKIATVEC
ncbi:hypothetical protein BDN70DRAFT_888388 [Pholiota conissans]|uniref:Uncharacterized protein n=1 Tax=Pholiota conissans TaxID=109636 RepID=A0A9P5YLW6_9AGAR|nr:hypothetical protein BDN70DRAFT_888388 [Pholiota conissans]